MCRISRYHSRWMKQQQEAQKVIYEQFGIQKVKGKLVTQKDEKNRLRNKQAIKNKE